MSSTLKSLIRLHRWQVDERRRQVAELEGFAEKLRQDMARLAEERAAEQTAAARRERLETDAIAIANFRRAGGR